MGNREPDEPANAFSISWGISPASSGATKAAFDAMALSTASHSDSVRARASMKTRYGRVRDPCTDAFTWPGPMSMATT